MSPRGGAGAGPVCACPCPAAGGGGAPAGGGGPGAPSPHSRRPQPARRAEPGSGAHSAEWETEAPASLRARREAPGPRLAAAPGLEVKASRGPKSWRKSHFAVTLVSQRGRSPRGIRDRPQDSAGRRSRGEWAEPCLPSGAPAWPLRAGHGDIRGHRSHEVSGGARGAQLGLKPGFHPPALLNRRPACLSFLTLHRSMKRC